MYQVIYSSVVIWCAILTWLLMGRALSMIQWIAIIGTSIGLGVSSLDSFQGSSYQADDLVTEGIQLNVENYK
jgi:drug/metabolite transporter (DMT)-like permease